MNKTIRILAIVLAVQTAAAAYTLTGHSTLEAKPANSDLLSFDTGQVDHLTLNGAENDSVEIVKQGSHWVLPGDGNFPADQAKVGSVLDNLRGLKRGLPVATSGADFARFKVDDKTFERHLQLKKGSDVVADLYLGNGAGVNQSFARISKDKAVYNVAIGTYDLPAKADNWEDKTVLKLDAKAVAAISINGGLKLTRTATADNKVGNWQAALLESGKQVKQAAVDQWLSQLVDVNFSKVLGKEAKPDYGLDKPVLEVSLTHGKDTRTYQFGKLKDDNYVLKVSDRPEYFQFAGFAVKPLLDGVGSDKLLESVTPPPAAAPTAPQPAPVPVVTQPPAVAPVQ
jgi:hypothetical protein